MGHEDHGDALAVQLLEDGQTSMLVRVSRLPVGSSARMRTGSFTSARAMATRCCWPPESWEGWWSRPVRQPHRDQLGLGVLASRAGVEARIKERQLHVLERRGAGEEIESLEDEADLELRSGEASPERVRDVLAVEHVDVRRSAVEAAEEIHEGGLAGARRAHDRHEVARANLQETWRRAVQRPDRPPDSSWSARASR
jgi:hypothetical protein